MARNATIGREPLRRSTAPALRRAKSDLEFLFVRLRIFHDGSLSNGAAFAPSGQTRAPMRAYIPYPSGRHDPPGNDLLHLDKPRAVQESHAFRGFLRL